jgi:predicted lipoprotein with Yx(FWY)xxD motif
VLAAGALSAALVLGAPAGTAGATSSHPKTIKVSTAKIPNVGVVLTTASGLTLYRFTQDASGTSSCTGVCAKIWPPLLASKGAHVSGPRGVKGLSVINVGNGHFQVAFHKVALYHFSGDMKKGQAHGQSVAGKWFAVLKSGIPATAATGAAPSTSTTAPAPGTTQPTTQTTPTSAAQHSTTGGNSTAPTQTPGTQAPTPSPTTPPTSPPTTPTAPPTTPPTSPPTTTTAPVGGTGGAGF